MDNPDPSTMDAPKTDIADAIEDKEFKEHVRSATERTPKLSTGYDLSKRRESNTSVKSGKSSYSASSRRGSRADTDEDEFDENGMPHIPNITYRYEER